MSGCHIVWKLEDQFPGVAAFRIFVDFYGIDVGRARLVDFVGERKRLVAAKFPQRVIPFVDPLAYLSGLRVSRSFLAD